MSAIAEAIDDQEALKYGEKAVKEMARLLVERGVTPERLGRLRKVNGWQVVTKKKNGKDQPDTIEKHDLFGFNLAPEWDNDPEWPVIQPGPTVRVAATKGKPVAKRAGTTTTCVLPDIQAGYFRGADGELVSIHDEAAVDAALNVVAAVNPDRVVLVGDNLDGAELGKYRTTPAFQYTTQATIDWLTTFCARLDAAAPNADKDWLAGNHEERLTNFMLDNAVAAFGLRQGNAPASWPVMSIPHLCRLDERNIAYRPGYPASDIWLSPKLKVIHGNRVKSRGSTAHVYLGDSNVSVIYGHIHRVERAHRTWETHDGIAEIMAASPGCLARIDGVVPSMGQGLDLDGRPIPRAENWQQGMAVVTVENESGDFDYEHVAIRNGTAFWRGETY